MGDLAHGGGAVPVNRLGKRPKIRNDSVIASVQISIGRSRVWCY
jgi:hypothetical protein